VNAVKHGRLLILEGIEKAERGIMPVLNNLLENREMYVSCSLAPTRVEVIPGT